MAIAAETMGVGIGYIGAVQRAFDELIDELKHPGGVLPVLAMCVGFPDVAVELRPWLPTDIVFHERVYREPSEENLDRCFEAMEAVTAFGGWYE